MDGRRSTSTDSAPRPAALEPGSAAWLAAVPAVGLAIAAMALLGPALGRLLLSPPRLRFWPEMTELVHPEPTERARFLIALSAPVVLAVLTALLARRSTPREPRAVALLVRASQLAFATALLACFVAQWTYRYPGGYAWGTRVRWFLPPTLVLAAAIAAAIALVARSPRGRARFRAWTTDARGRQLAALLLAAVVLALTLLPAVATDDSLLLGHDESLYHLQFTYDETMAVLDGRSPLGDFATQYAALWPYASAAAMRVLGSSVLGFTLSMALLTAAAMLALLDVLRRVTRSTVVAVLLFLPLLATSAFRLHGPADMRFSLVNYYGTMPLRYAGPFLLAWLVARQLDGARSGRTRRTWPVFLAGALVAVNNVDFGVPALVASAVALVATRLPTGRMRLRALALDAAIGLAAAALLVCGLLLLRTGALPDVSLAFRYARIFGQAGFVSQAMLPRVGMSTILYLTQLAALATATARTLRREPDVLLTGMLVWSGVFGLGAGAYYVGHSIPEVLTNLFPSWALSVVLLTVVVVRRLGEAAARRPTAPDVACLLAFGVLVCSLGQTPKPWTELRRIGGHAQPVFRTSAARAFVAGNVRPGEHVAMLMQLGHRLADTLGIVDVTPYTGLDSMKTVEQLDETLRILQREHGRKVFVAIDPFASRLYPRSLPAALPERGFQLALQAGEGNLQMWIRS